MGGADASEAEAVAAAASESASSNGQKQPTPAPEQEKEDFFASQELVEELKDPQNLGRRGEAWLLACLLCLGLVVWPPVPLHGVIAFLGTVALTAGIVFFAYALVSLGRNFSPMPLPRAKHCLVMSGMYSYVRHPQYAGLLLVSFGLAAITKSEIRLALSVLMCYLVERLVDFEEAALMETYPEQYSEYRGAIRKYLPFVY